MAGSGDSRRARMTDRWIRALPAAQGKGTADDYRDADVPGLVLRVFANGEKSWMIRLRIAREGSRKLTWIVLGRYPGLSLADARTMARTAKGQAENGLDPRKDSAVSTKQRKQEAAEASRSTFGALADEFFEKYVAKNLKSNTARQYRWALKGHKTNEHGPGVKAWQETPITEITKREVRNLIDGLVERGCPIQANRQLAYLKTFFAWCADREYLEVVPTDRIRPPVKNNHRDRALTNQELVEVYRAIIDDPGRKQGGIFRALLSILLLTGQRRDEVAGMRWSELKGLDGDAPVWEIPGERTKNHRPHVVPIAPQVLEILRSVPRILGSDFVFTTTGMTSVSGFSRAKVRVDEAIAAARKKAKVKDAIPGWTLHDLRRTVSTRMHEDLGILPHIVEAVLNHISGARAGVAGVYNRALYQDEKRQALGAWADHVEGLLTRRE